MRKLILLPLLLLGACVSRWPDGSYNDLTAGVDSEAVIDTISECTAYLVPNHATVNVTTTADALALLLPEALSRQGLVPAQTGLPVTYVLAATGDGAFIRVVAPRGICAQYLTRDGNGILQTAGPVTVVLR